MEFSDQEDDNAQQQVVMEVQPRRVGRPAGSGMIASRKAITLKGLGDEIKYLRRKKIDDKLLGEYTDMYDKHFRKKMEESPVARQKGYVDEHGNMTNLGYRKVKTFVLKDNMDVRSMPRFKNCYRLIRLVDKFIDEEKARNEREKLLERRRKKYRYIIRQQMKLREGMTGSDYESESDEEVEDYFRNHQYVTEETINDSDLSDEVKSSILAMQEIFKKKIGAYCEIDSDDEEENQNQANQGNQANQNQANGNANENQQNPAALTVEQMMDNNDERGLFEKAKVDYAVGSNIRIHWSDQPGTDIEDQEIFNAQITKYTNKRRRGGERNLWVNIKYVDHRGWNESIGRSNAQPFSDFYRRLVR
jgi:hypothetical protein